MFKDETGVQMIFYTPVTVWTVAKVLSLAVSPTSSLGRKTLLLFNFSKIPPFCYSVAMVSLREPAKVQHTHRTSRTICSAFFSVLFICLFVYYLFIYLFIIFLI